MKYYIQPNTAARHGYEFVVAHDDGHEEIIAMNRKTTDGYIHIPTDYIDAVNRKLVKFTDFEGKGRWEVTYRDGTRKSDAPTQHKVTMMERGNVLTDPEEKAMWQKLCKKIEHMELITKAKAELDAKQAAYEELLKGAQA